MVSQQAKQCLICGTEFIATDPRKQYCKPACKQEAHRQRHNIAKPDFLRNTGTSTGRKERPQSKTVPNPVYVAKREEIKALEGRLSGFHSQKQHNMSQEARLLDRDPKLLGNLTTAAISAGALIGAMAIGVLASKALKDKNDSDKAVKIALLIGLGLAAFMAMMTYEGNQEKQQQRKIRQIEKLKAECDQLDQEIQISEAKLVVLRMELCTIDATISREDYQDVYEPRPDKSSGNVITAADLRQMDFDLLTQNEGYTRLYGRPERGFAMAVYGLPGSGKSTFTIELAAHLAKENGKGIYIAAEEGFGQSLQDKMREIDTDTLAFSNHKTLASVRRELKNQFYDIVVLDSIQQMNIKPDELLTLRNFNKQTSFIYILQATKAGNFKGDNRFAHDADVQIKVDGYVPEIEKSRFSGKIVS